jgi:3-dehydroquinate dehydratase II
MPVVACINGPNLDLLGRRQPEVYGTMTLEDLAARVRRWGDDLELEIRWVQSNHEGELVEAVHSAAGSAGIVINPGALTHTSQALHDALLSVETPAVEVHLSNVRARERWRRRSTVAPACVLSVFGRGAEGYRAALRHLVARRASPPVVGRYGPHPDQVVHLRGSGGDVGVVLVHGGIWSDAWGLDTVDGWAVDLAERGVANASVEYRRTGSGGGPVATPGDVARAIESARSWLDVPEVAVIGHSAGAHLAVWHALTSSSPALLTVGVAGIYDLEAALADDLGPGAVVAFDPECSTDLIGAGHPRGRLALVHGEDDPVVPVTQTMAYARALSGDDPSVSLLSDTRHFDLLDPRREGWRAVLDVLATAGLG